MIHRIYSDGSYDADDGDALHERAAGRLLEWEIDLPDGADLPEPWASAKAGTLATVEEPGAAGQRAELGELAERVRGPEAEADTLRAIREQIDVRLAELGGGK
jgi:hypothetical protein